MHSQQQEFDVLEGDLDGLPVVAIIDSSLRDYEEKERFPWCLSLITPILRPSPNGMPTFPETDSLNRWEEMIRATLDSCVQVKFVGRVTGNGQRQLIYYVNDEAAAIASLRHVNDKEQERCFTFECVFDSDWEGVGIYY